MIRWFVMVWVLFSNVKASAAVVEVIVDRRVSSFPFRAALDFDADGAGDFRFEVSSLATTDVPASLGVDLLEINPEGGAEGAVLGNYTLQPGALLGQVLPVVNAEGGRDFGRDYPTVRSRPGVIVSETLPIIFSNILARKAVLLIGAFV